MTVDLLDIPPFLRRVYDPEAHRRRQAADKRRRGTRRWVMPDPSRRYHPTKAQWRRLEKLGWSDSQIRVLTQREVEQAIQFQNGPEGRFPSAAERKLWGEDKEDG